LLAPSGLDMEVPGGGAASGDAMDEGREAHWAQ
jgi:hypothetical protein